MLNLLIARHGNTFDKGDEILRVGKRTDLPLSLSGKEQAVNLGKFLKNNHPNIDQVLVSNLIRTQETAQLVLDAMGLKKELHINSLLDEIDYGPDEGQPEEKVIDRIGLAALEQWETEAIAPKGWEVEPNQIIIGWKNLANSFVEIHEKNTTVLIVTSNGIARFAPYITDDFEEFTKNHSIKMKTGAVSCFHYIDNQWQVKYWNQR